MCTAHALIEINFQVYWNRIFPLGLLLSIFLQKINKIDLEPKVRTWTEKTENKGRNSLNFSCHN